MTKKGGRNIGQCVYCGLEKELSKDHVPPKNLFRKPRPSNLITVNSCDSCNKGFEKDDEYFRAIVATLEESERHPEAKAIWETKISSSFSRPNQIGFRELFLQSLKPVEVYSKGGIFLGKRITYEIDLTRINKVIERTVTGIFWHEKGFRLSNDFEVKISMQPDTDKIKPTAIAAFAAQRAEVIENGVFAYKFLFYEEEPFGSGWLLLFYESVPFICMTIPINPNTRI